MGIGTLIVLIASMLIAVIAAGVLIQATTSMQEKSLTTSDQARHAVATSADVVSISAVDGSKTNLTEFEIIMRLSPGSEEIRLTQTVIAFHTFDHSANLKYAGTDAAESLGPGGFFTNKEQEFGQLRVWEGGFFNQPVWFIGNGFEQDILFDLDGDGITDTVIACGTVQNTPCPVPYNGSYLRFTLSSAGIVYAALRNHDGTLATLSPDAAGAFNITSSPIGEYGYITGYRSNANNPDQISVADTNIRFGIYKNPEPIGSDLDEDGQTDYFAINRTHALFIISSLPEVIGIPFGTQLTGGNTLDVVGEAIHDGTRYATLTIDGVTTAADQIDADVAMTLLPDNAGSGYYTVTYLQTGVNHIPGNLQRGDVIRIMAEPPRGIVGLDDVRIVFIPKVGTPTAIEFTIQEVLSRERHFLYP